jgi:hypothetical protein
MCSSHYRFIIFMLLSVSVSVYSFFKLQNNFVYSKCLHTDQIKMNKNDIESTNKNPNKKLLLFFHRSKLEMFSEIRILHTTQRT